MENMLCAEGIGKWSPTGQDKPLLPSTGESQLLCLRKGTGLKSGAPFPQFLFSFVRSWLLKGSTLCSGFLLCMWAGSKPDFSRIMAFLKEKAVVKSRVLL